MIIKTCDLVKRYKDNIVIDNLNLAIREGEIFGLLGPNGAGKTTLINSLLGLTKIDKGEIQIFEKLFKIHHKEIKRQIGIVPQDLAIYEDLTAYENVDLFASLYGLKRKEKKTLVEEALAFVDLIEKKDQYPSSFSGGMKRRLNIAMAIVHQPKLVIMDEPTVGIDPQSRNKILDAVRTLNSRGITIIYTTHYMEEVEAVCSRIAIMDKGRVIAEGTKETLKSLINYEKKARVKVDIADKNLLDKLKAIIGNEGVSQEKNEIEITLGKNESQLSEVVKSITSNGYNLYSVGVEEPNLETVFLTLTGKKLRDQ